MKVKMVDVARYLGISKATVSLAVNGKPGVNEQTRQRILACIEEFEKNSDSTGIPYDFSANSPVNFRNPLTPQRLIKVLIINHRKQVVCDPELDLWSEVLRTFDSEARSRGYLYGLSYINETEYETNAVISECNTDLVAGVIVFATEMTASDYPILEKIHKPVVIYDHEIPGEKYNSVCIDNEGAVKTGLTLLHRAGATDIRYLCTGKNIYNFQKRKEAFCNTLIGNDHYPAKSDIIELGHTIPAITEEMQTWLDHNPLPQGFLFENYQVSIGVLTALRKRGIKFPDQIKAVGIDEIPEYVLSGAKLTQIRIPHAERAAIAMDLMDKEIHQQWKTRIKIYAQPEVILKQSL